MKTTSVRTLLALAALASLVSFAPAAEPGFGNVLGRWSAAQSNNMSGPRMQEVAHAADGGAMGEDMSGVYSPQYAGDTSYGMNMNGPYNSCSQDGCSCEGCQGGCQGDCYAGGCQGDCYAGGCDESNYCGAYGDCGDCGACDSGTGMVYAEIQNMFLRAHVSDQVVGKLREKYEYSPRLVFGYESPGGMGARARYWNYSRTTAALDGNGSLGLYFDVVDVEGTTRLSSGRADLLLSGGFRWANLNVAEDDIDEVDSQMPGITFAADVRSAICCTCRSQWSGVFGARWSLLGGDWEGNNNNVIAPTFDDNLTAQEYYGGFEYLCHRCGYNLYARIVFEMQTWHSDALSATSATDSIGFVGPAIHGGITF